MNLKNNPELIPLIDWWEKDGKQFVLWLAVAALVVGGYYGFKNHRAAQRAAASSALAESYSTEQLEESVAKFAGAKSGPALRQRLAKSYFDAGRYEEALAQYEQLLANPAEGFADVPAVGKAQCLEALGRYDEAAKAFDAFAEANAKHYLTLTAQLGAARCFVASGDAKKALARIEALKKAYAEDELAKARVEATEDVIKRYGQKASEPKVEVKAEVSPEVKAAATNVAVKAEAALQK